MSSYDRFMNGVSGQGFAAFKRELERLRQVEKKKTEPVPLRVVVTDAMQPLWHDTPAPIMEVHKSIDEAFERLTKDATGIE